MKYTTTEKYHTNCPNCGAVLGENDKFCTYCGSRVVYERTVVQEDSYSIDGNRVDIESQASGDENSSNGNFGGMFFTGIWCGIALFMTFEFFEVGGIMGVFPLGMFIFGVSLLIKQIKNQKYHNEVINSSKRYKATVLDHCVYTETHGSGKDEHTVTLAKVKVLAEIDGQQKVIMIKVGNPTNAARYPEGSSVNIAGKDNYYIIV